MSSTAPLVRLDAVVKRFPQEERPALNGVSAGIAPGRVTGLVGPDGAGKTTLIRLVTGLMLPTGGRIEVLGMDTRSDSQGVQNVIGYMPQRFGLYEDLSVIENLNLYAELRGLPGPERPAVFDQLLDFTALAPFVNRHAGRLSGGMKQKLGLACALIRTPKVLLLDEPSVGVDPISRRELWRMVQDLVGEGIAVVWSTAYLDEAERCSHVLLLNEGELLFQGPPAELTARVEGRVIRVTGVEAGRRRLLTKALETPQIMDGVIQGRAIRLVYRDKALAAGSGHGKSAFGESFAGAEFETAPPRFEDAFVDILGGAGGGQSKLAARTPRIVCNGANENVIEAVGLTKRFGDFTAARDMTFTISRGEIFGLLGPNGAGKSTTFKMLCGLLKPTAGEGHVAGHDLRRATADARSRLGYMAQKFSLYGDLSVAQNLDFFAGVYGLNSARRREKIAQMVETFDLAGHLRRNARDLPLGFKQRLALACALMHEPEALFLDEPTSGVDPLTRREFWTHINGLVEKGVAVLVTTHFMDEAEYCDRIALIYRGQTIALGAPDQLKSDCATAENPDPTLEDAFVALVEAFNARERTMA
jgi:ABC-2 type transport system ATP-binding protein